MVRLFTLMQFVESEKRLEMQGTVCLGFVDMEKAFDSLSREKP